MMMILPSIVYALGLLTAHVNGETCPSPEKIDPCICNKDEITREIVVSCADKSITLGKLEKALNCLIGKNDVEMHINGLDLGRVTSHFFNGIKIKRLGISHCKLDSLSDDARPALLGLEDTLEQLRITSSFSEDNMPASLRLGHLRKLKELDISSNTITELTDDWFDRGPVTLEYIYIFNNGIEKVGDNAFAHLVNLKRLSFRDNRFSPLKRSMLPEPAQKLTTLIFDNNAITSIPEDLFRGMPSLEVVSFRKNGIVRLEQRTWQPVWQQLYALYLEENPIECNYHMNWIFSLRATSAIYGKCAAPLEIQGLHLQDFIDRRGS